MLVTVWQWVGAAFAASPGVYVSSAQEIEVRSLAGGPEGWLAIGYGAGGPSWTQFVGRRVGADGVAIDAVPVALHDYAQSVAPVWDGDQFTVVASRDEQYYGLYAHLDVVRLPMTGSPSAPATVASSLRWPRLIAGACDGIGGCWVALADVAWDAPIPLARVGFDTAGAVTDPLHALGLDTAIGGAARDGAFLATTTTAGEFAWLPDDPAAAIERVAGLPHTAAVAAGDGVVLAVWTEVEHAGDSGAPNPVWTGWMQRAQRGVGLLDPEPVALGEGQTSGVAFDGAAFVVGFTGEAGPSVLRIGTDGQVDQAFAVPIGCPSLATGPAGHVMCADLGSAVIVEIDVPDGGACHDEVACLSGVCGGGICGATGPFDSGTGGTGVAPPPGDSGAEPPPAGDSGDDGTLAGSGCACASSGGSALGGSLALGGLLLAARRRRRG